MPLKFGFQRRKSSGNALADVPDLTPPQSSFRVLDRHSTAPHNFDGGHKTRGRTNSDVRPYSEGQFLEYQQGQLYPGKSVNRLVRSILPFHLLMQQRRGSASTQLSGSSGHGDTSGSSLRHSASSTVPSAASSHVDLPSKPVLAAKSTNTPNFLKSAGKAFSFAAKKGENQHISKELELPYHSAQYDDIPDPDLKYRKRATTDLSYISDSTTKPSKTAYDGNWQQQEPKENDWRLSLKGEGDDFSKMFENREVQQSKSLEQLGIRAIDHESLKSTPIFEPPPALNLDRIGDAPAGPMSGTSQGSFDQLLTRSPVEDDEEEEDGYGYRSGNWPSSTTRKSPSRNLTESPSAPLMRTENDEPSSNRSSGPMLDAHTRDIIGFFNSTAGSAGYAALPPRQPSPTFELSPPDGDYQYEHRGVELHDGDYDDMSSIQPSRQPSFKSCNSARAPSVEPELESDLDFKDMANAAAKFEAGESPIKEAPKLSGKVMSAAEFEKYKREIELNRSNSNESDESETDDTDDYYDAEEDEQEKNKEMIKQRRKQEARMSVYRQQMMKVTGEKHLPIATSQLDPKISLNDLKGKAKENASDEEDEDVPLGILAAHGFPSKERPPSHIPRTASTPSIRYASDAYPAPVLPQASSSSLPAFARGLPQDPYAANGLVNPVVREGLGFGTGNRPGSVYGGSQHGGSSIPPGGLVGVIAQEEQARAARRGSPHANFGTTPAQPLPMNMQGFQQQPAQPIVQAETQAQMAMNQQLQMMQMQMQMMQQMMAVQGAQMNGMPMNGMSMPGMAMPMMGMPQQGMQQLGPPMQNMMQRGLNQQRSNPNLRASTMMGSKSRPTSSHQPGYPPSIAPSERSNVGQAARYRPVSIAPRDNGRASTLLSNPLSGNIQQRPVIGTRSSTSNLLGNKPGSTLRMVVKDTGDDDAAWEETRRKKETKKKLWRSKTSQHADGKENGLDDVFYPTEIP